jgi:hypothetical protein
VIERMPPAEVERLDELYQRLEHVRADEVAERAVAEEAGGYFAREADASNLEPRDLDKLIDLATQLLIAHARIGTEQLRLTGRFGDFSPAPKKDAIMTILSGGDGVPADVAAAHAATEEYHSILNDQAPPSASR